MVETAAPTRDQAIAELTAPDADFALEEITVNGVPLRAYRNAPASLRDAFAATETFEDKDFLIYRDERLTFREFRRQAMALATHLRAIGVVKGDRVAIAMRNYPEWVTSFWACQLIGAVTVALNAWWTSAELQYALDDSGSVVVIADPERFERIKEIAGSLNLREIILVRGTGTETGVRRFEDIVAGEADMPAVEIGPDDYATILYTSGTTGRSKGAVATHRNHITNIMNTLLGGAAGMRMAGITEPPDVQPGALQTFPFFHIGGLTGLYLSTTTGSKLAVMYRWSAPEAVDLIETHGLNAIAGVPYVVRQLLESARAAGRSLPTLQAVGSGGASVPPDLVRTIGTQFETKVAPSNGYGLTETTSAVITHTGLDYLARPDSVGKPVVTADVRIVGDNGRDCAQGEIGELWIRGTNVIPGYWRNEAATAEAFTDGWFHTGDLGYRDEAGRYHVVDRKKDVIIRGGENIYCTEVEAALLEHPLVHDTAVLGLPHPELGEMVACVVQIDDTGTGHEQITAELNEHLGQRMAKFKVPARYSFTTEELPRTATGKLLKREMASRYFS